MFRLELSHRCIPRVRTDPFTVSSRSENTARPDIAHSRFFFLLSLITFDRYNAKDDGMIETARRSLARDAPHLAGNIHVCGLLDVTSAGWSVTTVLRVFDVLSCVSYRTTDTRQSSSSSWESHEYHTLTRALAIAPPTSRDEDNGNLISTVMKTEKKNIYWELMGINGN